MTATTVAPVPELAALRPSSLAHGLTSASGERTVYESEVAAMRTVFAMPPGPDIDDKLPAALNTALHFHTDLEVARDRLLAALPRAGAQPPAWQRNVFSAAHAQFAREAAPLLAPDEADGSSKDQNASQYPQTLEPE